jgi:hypothetical protein
MYRLDSRSNTRKGLLIYFFLDIPKTISTPLPPSIPEYKSLIGGIYRPD